MGVKDIVRPLLGVRLISTIKQKVLFDGSADFWERRYSQGGSSGAGSYGVLAYGKARFINSFVQTNSVGSVIEFGCGDGNQLSLAEYPRYIGLDVSRSAIGMCITRFAHDPTKSFVFYDGAYLLDNSGWLAADLAISLDVIYHLVEDEIFESYMKQLFIAALRYVIVYSTNQELLRSAPHVRHRSFTSWVDSNLSDWKLINVQAGPSTTVDRADFYVYEKIGT
jgi:SAM-dependent methyltransferase